MATDIAQRPSSAGSILQAVAALARLELDERRKATVALVLDAMNRQIDRLDGVDLADVPPATGYNPRWV